MLKATNLVVFNCQSRIELGASKINSRSCQFNLEWHGHGLHSGIKL